ncbi:MAG: VTT domain-containing protein [bacterium]
MTEKSSKDRVKETASGEEILVPGRNCWRKVSASRMAFLVDAASYYEAFAKAAERARHSIIIVGWDIDSRTRLRRDSESELPSELGGFLNHLVSENPSLQVHILIWDYSMFYANEREPLLSLKFGWMTGPRIQFQLDGIHPVGASHHQKIVVIDDTVAFVGGLDLTTHRWDTSEHLPEDPRRITPGEETYGPYHDVQVALEGEAAAGLAELVRDRWKRATGKRVEHPPLTNVDPWPEDLAPDLTDVKAGIVRTDPAGPDGEILEVENLYLDLIHKARQYIYMENQFLTSAALGDALAARLQEESGPEIILVMPGYLPGWVEDKTMGLMRSRLIWLLKQNDHHGRLRVLYPTAEGKDPPQIFVHAKVAIVDDVLARVGSANLSNRSMGLDTECDVAVEADGQDRVIEGMRGFLSRLLGEHLGVEADKVDEARKKEGSLVKVIDKLSGPGRSLHSMVEDVPEWIAGLLPESTFFDPEKTIVPRMPVETLLPEQYRYPSKKKRVAYLLLIGFIIAGLFLAWEFTPLKDYASPEAIAELTAPVEESPFAPLIIIAAYIVGGALMFPVTVLILATAMMFGPLEGFIYAMVGSLISSVIYFRAGELLGKDLVWKLAGARINQVSRRIANRGVMAVALLRLVPVAPFTVINLAAGVSHIRFRHYLLGTALGMSPGIVAITVFGDRLARTLQDPTPSNLGVLAGVLAVIILAFIAGRLFIKRRLERRRRRKLEL